MYFDPTGAATFCGISYPTLRRLISRGQFPAPVRLAGRQVVWPEATLSAWKAERKAIA